MAIAPTSPLYPAYPAYPPAQPAGGPGDAPAQAAGNGYGPAAGQGYDAFQQQEPQIQGPMTPQPPAAPVMTPQPPATSMTSPQPAAAAAAPELQQALQILAQTVNRPEDEAYLRSIGIDIVFHNGQEALDVIQRKGIRVAFGDMGDSKAHAQWIAEENTILINQKYQGDFSRDNLYALAEAIYHEAGHAARLGDNQASLQEELNCLGLNTLAYRAHVAMDPQFAQSANSSRLIQDGVALYNRLFFDADPNKHGLVSRVIEKYGDLPPSTPDHLTPILAGTVPMADRVCRQIQANRTLNLIA